MPMVTLKVLHLQRQEDLVVIGASIQHSDQADLSFVILNVMANTASIPSIVFVRGCSSIHTHQQRLSVSPSYCSLVKGSASFIS